MSEEPIVSTKDKIGDYDAIETAKPGEPLFPLQGGDPFAPATIEFWSDLVRTAARKEEDATKREKLLRKATAAELVAWVFRDYQRDPTTIAASEEQKRFESEDVTDQKVILARVCERLNNAVAEIVTAAEKLESLGDTITGTAAKLLRDNAQGVKEISEEIEPRRHMRRKV